MASSKLVWGEPSKSFPFYDRTSGESKVYIVGADACGLRQIGRVDGFIGNIIGSSDGKSPYYTRLNQQADLYLFSPTP